MDILDRKMLTNNLMSLIRKKHSGGRFGLGDGGQRQSMSPQFMAQSTPMMISATSGGRRPWQKGKALEDYMMKKLRDRDNEEFYKGWKGMGSGGIHRRTDNPRPLQDYGDWDEQDPMFPNTPKPYRNPVFDTMPQNKTRRQF